ncbi:MAG: glycoside hydrolase family 2, sugar binding, partial [Ferruginibacter sp.]|nr:glycoside hydrolase family 2, sugar binding [Ferruginibacter sp.]
MNKIIKIGTRTKINACRCCILMVGIVLTCYSSTAQTKVNSVYNLANIFKSPPPAASPWVFWYWNQAVVSKEGITADVQAMKDAGIGGAYLMFIKGAANPPLMEPAVIQLSPLWWQMVGHAMKEAKRLGLKIGLHVSDGFALAGGPWITPELSMQKIVWTTTNINGGKAYNDTLQQPETIENYYEDIAVFAYPSTKDAGISTRTVKPLITSSKADSVLPLLVVPGNKKNFTCDDSCWIQYEFQQPFACRTVTISSRTN